jgi:hypothetical protein
VDKRVALLAAVQGRSRAAIEKDFHAAGYVPYVVPQIESREFRRIIRNPCDLFGVDELHVVRLWRGGDRAAL